MKNISIAALLSSFLATAALGNDLDKALVQVNKDLNPKALNDFGWDVEYRQEHNGKTFTWINITKVQRVCRVEKTSYFKDGKIVTADENRCGNGMVMTPDSLFQIDCLESTGNKCINALAEAAGTDTIKQVIAQKIKKLYVK